MSVGGSAARLLACFSPRCSDFGVFLISFFFLLFSFLSNSTRAPKNGRKKKKAARLIFWVNNFQSVIFVSIFVHH
jgi:hypothetical protein